MYRRILALALLLALALTGCAQDPTSVDEACVAATTYPVWQFTCAVTEGTGLRVERVISEPVSCVHDYALSVEQMKILSRSRAVVISGLGLEDFMADVLPDGERCIDASAGIETLSAEAHDHDHDHDHDGHGHDHEHGEADPHLWLDPARAGQMVRNIAAGLSGLYPAYAETFSRNAEAYCAELDKLLEDGRAALSGLSCRELVTFHDGFGYFADWTSRRPWRLRRAANRPPESWRRSSGFCVRAISPPCSARPAAMMPWPALSQTRPARAFLCWISAWVRGTILRPCGTIWKP